MRKIVEPEEIESKEFLVSLRGYDREEVDKFLKAVAAELQRLRTQTASAQPSSSAVDAYRRVGEETSRILVAAEETANNIREQAKKEAEGLLSSAKKEAQDTITAARKQSEETLAAARKESVETLAAARKESEETTGAARQEAAEILGAARQEATAVEKSIAEALAAAEEDLEALKQARTLLATQLEDVRRRLDETIARLQAPLETLPPRKTGRLPSISPTVTERPEAPPRPRGAEALVETPTLPVEAPPEPAAPTEELARTDVEALPAEEVVAPEEEMVAEAPPAEVAPTQDTEVAPAPDSLEALLDEIRLEREQARTDVDEALAKAAAITGKPEVPEDRTIVLELESAPDSGESAPSDVAATEPDLQKRAEALGDTPSSAARRLKRLLQEDQNDLLDRIRTHRGRGTFDTDISPEPDQVARFEQGLYELLGGAFESGRGAAGATDASKPDEVVRSMVVRQLIAPLRKELAQVVQAGIEAQDTPTSIAERASDIYRVWKGVRTELLGEGLVYSAYHQGLMDVWRRQGAGLKQWVFATDEDQCPREICKSNAGAGPVAVDSAFPSGHIAPPAHGGCTCTLSGPQGG